MTLKINLPNTLKQQIYDQALSDPDNEVCGLLGGQHQIMTSYYPVRNIAPDAARRYLMDPAEQIAAMKSMRDRGETLAAIFHSHTNAPAQPSRTDLELAYYPDTTYLILSLQCDPPELNAFFFDGTQFTQQQIQASDRN